MKHLKVYQPRKMEEGRLGGRIRVDSDSICLFFPQKEAQVTFRVYRHVEITRRVQVERVRPIRYAWSRL